ncbi:MAG: hypothetical protein HXX20_07565 [Chloroflexi bacterium]|nr:hypothetical protein [Chloroflexota bacterium]
MARTFICTVGTSLVKNGEIDIDKVKNDPIDQINSTAAKRVREAIINRIDNSETDDARKNLSAELKSLMLCHPKLEPDDEIFLLYADNLEGRLCAEGIKQALIEFVGYNQDDPNIILKRIADLQVKSFNDFTRKGIRNLYKEVIAIIKDQGGEYNPNLILNITGGYKAVVPYMTLLGFLYKKKIIYVFEEDRSELITLPLLPLTYDEDLLFRARHFLKRLQGEDILSATEFPKELEIDKARYIPAIIEEEQGLLTLTAFGELLYERLDLDYPADLPTTSLAPKDKPFKMPTDAHHDNEYIEPVVRKMLESRYVEKFLRGEKGNSPEKKGISKVGEDGEVTFNTGNSLGSRFTIKTSGRNPEETRRIAEHLIKKGYLN